MNLNYKYIKGQQNEEDKTNSDGFISNQSKINDGTCDKIINMDVGNNKNNKIPKKVTISWKSVCVEAPVGNKFLNLICKKKSQFKTILNNVHGFVEPGQMVALMGASGSGKTTLLNVLNFRSSNKFQIEGEIMINGAIVDAKKMSMVSCYIQQEDLFFGTLTVKEHLEFNAILRMDSKVPTEMKRKRVNEVLKELNLDICKDVMIGIPGQIKGISGGQKRRLAFASEILTDPPLLFCDEPTSGLDAYMAKSIVKCLKKMALDGKTIVCTIHQPSSEIFALFDHLCLLTEGNMAYFGEREKASIYFETKLNMIIPSYSNPADFYIDVLGFDVSNETKSRIQIKEYCEIFRNSSEYDALLEKINHISCTEFKTPKTYTNYKASWIVQMLHLLKRSYINYFRNYRVVISDVLMSLLTAVLGGIIYYKASEKVNGICIFDQKTALNLGTPLFYALIVMMVLSVFSAAIAFPLEIPVILREHHNSIYRSDTYYISKLLSEIPVYTILPALHGAAIYFLVQFGCDLKNFLYFILTLVLGTHCAFSTGHVVSILASNANMAISFAIPILALQMLFSGFFLNKAGKTPDILVNFKYLSAFNYGYDLLLINQWENVKNLTCEYTRPELCRLTGLEILKDLDVNQDKKMFDILMLGVLTVAWRILAYLILFIKAMRNPIQMGKLFKKNKTKNRN